MKKYTVMGVNDWPEDNQSDFKIVSVKEGESFEDAISRGKIHYSPELECYIVDEEGNRVFG